MHQMRQRTLQVLGAAGTATCIYLYIKTPSFPTPDKLLVFLLFIFLMFKQAIELLKRLGPFVAVILVYESFRGAADHLNHNVHYSLAPHVDKLVFGSLPTAKLQQWLWHGHASWYDIALYIPYLLFFVLPFLLAIVVWKTREKYYWQVIYTYVGLFFAGYLTFLLYPAAPPWLASQNHVIEPVTRISSYVWSSLGLHNFPSVYQHISPNPVAAIPSLHAACATLFSLFVFRLYGRRWGTASLIYPLMICFGVIYEGEHYAFDVVCGIAYALSAFVVIPRLVSLYSGLRSPKLKRRRLAKTA